MLADLQNLLSKEKFAHQVWIDRGLNPSSKSICIFLQSELNLIIEELLKLPSNYKDSHKIFLQNSLKNFDKYDLESEEKELLVDYFSEISKLINIDIDKNLNFWLYGFDPDEVPKTKPVEVLEIIENNCTSCQASLNIEVLKNRKSVPALWLIAQCNNCNHLNLLSIYEGIDRFKNGNFFVFELLRKNEYTLEEALKKLEFFRKNNPDNKNSS